MQGPEGAGIGQLRMRKVAVCIVYTHLRRGYMLCNLSNLDRVVRVLFAVVLIGSVVYFVPSPVPKTLLLATAILLLTSAWFGICYIYKLLGISTARPKA